jgi:hypothetical protein
VKSETALGFHFRLLVGGVIVENGVNEFSGGNGALDFVQETDELLMPVALHVAAYNRAVEDVQGGEERRRPVAPCQAGSAPE